MLPVSPQTSTNPDSAITFHKVQHICTANLRRKSGLLVRLSFPICGGQLRDRKAGVLPYYFANVPSDLSLLASGMAPAREAESAGAMPEVPKGQGLGRLAR